MKYLDTDSVITNALEGAYPYVQTKIIAANLTNITRGSGDTQRIGNNITVRKIECYIKAYAGDEEDFGILHTITDHAMGIYILLDKQANKQTYNYLNTAPTTTSQIWEDENDFSGTNVNVGQELGDFQNRTNLNRFKILHEWNTVVRPQFQYTEGTTIKSCRATNIKKIKIRCNIPIAFLSTSTLGGETQLMSNKLSAWVKFNSIEQSPNPAFSAFVVLNTRIHYTDN